MQGEGWIPRNLHGEKCREPKRSGWSVAFWSLQEGAQVNVSRARRGWYAGGEGGEDPAGGLPGPGAGAGHGGRGHHRRGDRAAGDDALLLGQVGGCSFSEASRRGREGPFPAPRRPLGRSPLFFSPLVSPCTPSDSPLYISPRTACPAVRPDRDRRAGRAGRACRTGSGGLGPAGDPGPAELDPCRRNRAPLRRDGSCRRPYGALDSRG